ncbi:MAG: hypothetical protein V3W41_15320 [Planctomycetota bacterium]
MRKLVLSVACILTLLASSVLAQDPDVIVGSIPNISNYTANGGVDALSIGTTSCNIGTSNLDWIANTNDHPVIAQHAYRLLNGRFEMIGQSWLKHGFTALTGNLCDTCSGIGGSVLGVGCSDPYGSGLNGSQGGLGPKFEVNASTGVFSYPFSNPNGSTGNSVFKRLQIPLSELGAPGAQYFVEAHYVTKDDAAAGNQNNNASYRAMTISGGPSNYSFGLTGSTVQEQPAIFAWEAADPSVTITTVDVPSDGRFHVAYKSTDNGNGTHDVEFAVHNLNSHRSGQAFTVDVPAGATITNIGFHDVSYHSGEPFANTDWSSSASGNQVNWSTETFNTNSDANALRWGTTYNFRFTTDMQLDANGSVLTTIDLFRSGSPTSVAASFDPNTRWPSSRVTTRALALATCLPTLWS